MKRKIAFNTHFVFLFIVMLVFVAFTTFFLINSNGNMFPAAICAIPTLIMIFVVLISPVIYIFEDDRLTIRYCVGIKEIIEWKEIRTITRCVGWFIGKSNAANRGLPVYDVDYQRKKKLPFFIKPCIVNNTKTTNLLKEYYKKNIKEYWD